MKRTKTVVICSAAAVAGVIAGLSLSGCDSAEDVKAEDAGTQNNNDGSMADNDGSMADIDDAPELRKIQATTFEIADVGRPDCPDLHSSGAGMTSPPPEELSSELGSDVAVFIVTLADSIDEAEFPLPEGRRDEPGFEPASDALYQARAAEVARLQVCAVSQVSEVGGNYLQSFLLINAFTAELDSNQAVSIAKHPNVQLVELSETNTPPPG